MMAKYGLAQIDLNLLVRMCGWGALDEPERHLSRLLRSHQPIERATRLALADALDGKSKGAKLKFTQTKYGDFSRRVRKTRERIEIGRKVQSIAIEQGYEGAIEAIAASSGRGEKTVQSCYTLANKYDAWAQQYRSLGLKHSEAALEVAFIYATTKRVDLPDSLEPSIETLAQILEMFEYVVRDARGAQF